MANDVSRALGFKTAPGFKSPERQNMEQTEDYAVKKHIDILSGTIQKVPANNADIANKAYVDSVAGGGLELGETSTTAYRGDRGKTAYDHSQNNNQAHTDYLKNDANDTSSGKITAEGFEVTGDRSSADTAYVPMVLYNTDATPPAASGFPIGTIYIQYTP